MTDLAHGPGDSSCAGGVCARGGSTARSSREVLSAVLDLLGPLSADERDLVIRTAEAFYRPKHGPPRGQKDDR